MTIFIDIDDTITNFGEILLQRLNTKYRTHFKLEDVTSWEWYRENFNNPWEVIDESFWEEVEVNAEAKNFIKKRLEKNDEIYLVSATFIDNNLPIKIEKTIEKLDNLIDKNHIIITHNKTLICGDVMIDDGVHNLIDNQCKLNFCVSEPWNWNALTITNKNPTYIIRTDDWNKIYFIIETAKAMGAF